MTKKMDVDSGLFENRDWRVDGFRYTLFVSARRFDGRFPTWRIVIASAYLCRVFQLCVNFSDDSLKFSRLGSIWMSEVKSNADFSELIMCLKPVFYL